MSIRLYVLMGSLLLVIGYTIGYLTIPQKIVTKTVIETKTVTVTQHDIQTVVIEKPDGTKTTTTIDKSVDTSKSVTDESKTKVVENGRPQWKVAIDLSPNNSQLEYFYGARIERRILGPIFVGAFGNTDKTFGLSIGVEF